MLALSQYENCISHFSHLLSKLAFFVSFAIFIKVATIKKYIKIKINGQVRQSHLPEAVTCHPIRGPSQSMRYIMLLEYLLSGGSCYLDDLVDSLFHSMINFLTGRWVICIQPVKEKNRTLKV